MSCMMAQLPDVIFVKATLGAIEIKSPSDACKTLSRIRSSCKELQIKVDCVWDHFIQYSDLIAYLFPLTKTALPTNSHTFIQLHYPTLKKWNEVDLQKRKDGNPQVNETLLLGYMEQTLLYTPQGKPQLWMVSDERTRLVCIDLTDQKEFFLSLNKKIQPLSKKCQPGMALSESWIALCCEYKEENKNKIEIIDRGSGSHLRTISYTGTALMIQCEGDYLYVLCKTAVQRSTLLRYDSRDWETLPEKLFLPKNTEIHTFCIGSKDLLFLSNKQIFAYSNADCFAEKPTLTIHEAEYPKVQVDEDGFYILFRKDSCNVEINRLSITNGAINLEPIQTLPLKISDIGDFNIQQDSVFIKIKNAHSISCYPKSGQKVKKFYAQSIFTSGTNFRPQFAVGPTAERIQLLFLSLKSIDRCRCTYATASLALSYGEDVHPPLSSGGEPKT